MATETAKTELTGQSRVIVNVLAGWGSYVLFFAAGFLLPHFIDNQLGKTMLGMWDFAWSIVNYLALSSIGIASNLNRFVAKHRAVGETEKVTEAASTVFVIQCALSVLLVLASAGIALTLPSWMTVTGSDLVTLQWVFFILGCSLAVQFLFDTSRGVLTGCHRWDLHSLLNAGSYMIAVIVMLTLLTNGYGLIEMSATYLTMHLCAGIVRHLIVRRICPEAAFSYDAISLDFAKTILVFGGKSILLMISPVIIIQTSYFIVMTRLEPALLAILARPVSLMRHIDSFLARFANILIPMAGSIESVSSKDQLRKFTLQSSKFGYAFALPIVGVFCVYGDEVIRIWMGDDYVNSHLIMILSLGYLLPLSQMAIVRILNGLDLHGSAALLSVCATIVIYLGTYFWIGDSEYIDDYAYLIVVPLTLVSGIIIPLYACVKMQLPIVQYLKEGFLAVTLCSGTTTFCLWYAQQTFDIQGVWILVSLAVYGSVTAILYWRFILTNPMRAKVVGVVRPIILKYAGNTGIMQSMMKRHQDTIPIFTIHGVANHEEDDLWQPTWPRCEEERLDSTLATLSKHYQFISMDEMVDMIERKVPPRKNCMVITFDDGYENNISKAMPILRKHNAPSTVYISTRMIKDAEPYWIDRLDYLLTNHQDNEFHINLPGYSTTLSWLDRDELREKYRSVREQLLEAYDDDYKMLADIEQFLDAAEKQAGSKLADVFETDKWSSLLTPEQIKTLDSDVTIGSHTVNHVRSNSIPRESLESEMMASKAYVESLTGHCEHFCYPLGIRAEHGDDIAKESGYRSAVTGDIGTNHIGDNPYRLKRISIPQGHSEGEVLYHLLRNLS